MGKDKFPWPVHLHWGCVYDVFIAAGANNSVSQFAPPRQANRDDAGSKYPLWLLTEKTTDAEGKRWKWCSGMLSSGQFEKFLGKTCMYMENVATTGTVGMLGKYQWSPSFYFLHTCDDWEISAYVAPICSTSALRDLCRHLLYRHWSGSRSDVEAVAFVRELVPARWRFTESQVRQCLMMRYGDRGAFWREHDKRLGDRRRGYERR